MESLERVEDVVVERDLIGRDVEIEELLAVVLVCRQGGGSQTHYVG